MKTCVFCCNDLMLKPQMRLKQKVCTIKTGLLFDHRLNMELLPNPEENFFWFKSLCLLQTTLFDPGTKTFGYGDLGTWIKMFMFPFYLGYPFGFFFQLK